MGAGKTRVGKAAGRRLEHDDTPGVEALIAGLSRPLEPLVQQIRRAILAADASITEGIKWNSPSFYCHGWFATLGCRKPDRIDVVLHCGAKNDPDCSVREAVEDPAGLLKWPSKDRALLAFSSEEELASRREAFQRIVASRGDRAGDHVI